MSTHEQGGTPGVLDRAILDELREDMEEEFGEVLEAFLDEVPVWLDSLAEALADGNAEGLFHTAHALKSSSGYMGATRMQTLAASIESRGRAGSAVGHEADLAALNAEFAAVRPRLEAMARE